jgi:hypothetical protein
MNPITDDAPKRPVHTTANDGTPTIAVPAGTATPQDAVTPGWCHWHNGENRSVVAVEAIKTMSGPGHFLYACAPCRDRCGLKLLDPVKAGR